MIIIKTICFPITNEINTTLIETNGSLQQVVEYDQDISTSLSKTFKVSINCDTLVSFEKFDQYHNKAIVQYEILDNPKKHHSVKYNF